MSNSVRRERGRVGRDEGKERERRDVEREGRGPRVYF